MTATATAALLDFLDALYRAAMARDPDGLHALLRRPLALHVPTEVRAEAIAIANSPAESLRAPIRMLQMQQRVTQLAASEDDDDLAQLELELRSAVRR